MAALLQFQYCHYFQPKSGLIMLLVVPHTVIVSGLWHTCRHMTPAVHPYWWCAITLHIPPVYPVPGTTYDLPPGITHTIYMCLWYSYGSSVLSCFGTGTHMVPAAMQVVPKPTVPL